MYASISKGRITSRQTVFALFFNFLKIVVDNNSNECYYKAVIITDLKNLHKINIKIKRRLKNGKICM